LFFAVVEVALGGVGGEGCGSAELEAEGVGSNLYRCRGRLNWVVKIARQVLIAKLMSSSACNQSLLQMRGDRPPGYPSRIVTWKFIRAVFDFSEREAIAIRNTSMENQGRRSV